MLVHFVFLTVSAIIAEMLWEGKLNYRCVDPPTMHEINSVSVIRNQGPTSIETIAPERNISTKQIRFVQQWKHMKTAKANTQLLTSNSNLRLATSDPDPKLLDGLIGELDLCLPPKYHKLDVCTGNTVWVAYFDQPHKCGNGEFCQDVKQSPAQRPRVKFHHKPGPRQTFH